MVMLDKSYVDQWPGVDEYLKDDFVQVTSNAKVMDALRKWYVNPLNPGHDLSEDRELFMKSDGPQMLYTVLKHGYPPTIQSYDFGCSTVEPGSGQKPGTNPPSMLYAMTFTATIVLSRDLLALVEYLKTKKASVLDPLAGMVKPDEVTAHAKEIFQFMECTILHEMIHWRHWRLGLMGEGEKDRIGKRFGSIEYPSYQFEVEAYGKRLSLWKQLCNTKNTDRKGGG